VREEPLRRNGLDGAGYVKNIYTLRARDRCRAGLEVKD
jgi:hypothetical protein